MKIQDFLQRFPDEESCQKFIREKREREGIHCRKCGGHSHFWYKTRSMWQCRNCRYRTSLKVGTVMEDSNLPIKTWMYAFYFMTHTKKSYSACELQRILGHSRYETVWYLMQRIRQFMSDKNQKLFSIGVFDHRENLNHSIPVRLKKRDKDRKKPIVFVNPESLFSSRFRGSSDYMLLVLSSDDQNKLIHSNGCQYKAISLHAELKYNFKVPVQRYQKAKLPKWVMSIITNTKNLLQGIHHLVKHKYLQLYLDEFSFKYNNRLETDCFSNFLDEVFKPFGTIPNNQIIST